MKKENPNIIGHIWFNLKMKPKGGHIFYTKHYTLYEYTL